jgi:hypothetical protein
MDKILDDAVDSTFSGRDTVDLRLEQTKSAGKDGMGS